MRYGRKVFICLGILIIHLANYINGSVIFEVKAREKENNKLLITEDRTTTNNSKLSTISAPASNTNKVSIASIQDIDINIYQNERDFLPELVNAKYTNGKIREVSIAWEDGIIDTNKSGKYTIKGKVEGYNRAIKCNINVEPLENIISKLIILPLDSYDKTEADMIIGRISKIYPRILKGLLDRGIHIRLINTPITCLPEYSYLKGLVPRGWENTGKTWDDVPGVSGNPIAIRIGYSEPGKGHGAVNLELHETAHTIDSYIFKAISSTKEFKDIWKEEDKKLFGDNSYFSSYPDEYFAEAFAMYYLGSEYKYELSFKAPRTFKFIEELEKRVN